MPSGPDQIVLCVWEDALAEDYPEQRRLPLPTQLVTCRTVGWLCGEDEKGISLAQDMQDMPGEFRVRHILYIPRAGIKSMTYLEEVPPHG